MRAGVGIALVQMGGTPTFLAGALASSFAADGAGCREAFWALGGLKMQVMTCIFGASDSKCKP